MLREAALVFHGLSKNAVNALLEVGNTEAEVSAIVEMSEQMVRHYARDVNKRDLARRRDLEDRGGLDRDPEKDLREPAR